MPHAPATSGSEHLQHSAPFQILTFRCGGHPFGVDVSQVREVVEPKPLTRVPDAPPWALGVMNLRGQVVPVVDLARRLDFPCAETPRPCILVADVPFGDDTERLRLGLQVESVAEVWHPRPDAIEEPPSFGIPVHPSYLLGVVEHRDVAVLLLDLPKILTAHELREALEAGGDASKPPAVDGSAKKDSK